MASARYIWIDDSLRPASEGVVPFLSAGVQYGFSVFEGIRCYATDRGPAVFRLDEHVERLLTRRTSWDFKGCRLGLSRCDRRSIRRLQRMSFPRVISAQ